MAGSGRGRRDCRRGAALSSLWIKPSHRMARPPFRHMHRAGAWINLSHKPRATTSYPRHRWCMWIHQQLSEELSDSNPKPAGTGPDVCKHCRYCCTTRPRPGSSSFETPTEKATLTVSPHGCALGRTRAGSDEAGVAGNASDGAGGGCESVWRAGSASGSPRCGRILACLAVQAR